MEPAALLRVSDEEGRPAVAFLVSAQVPLAEVAGPIPGVVEDTSDGLGVFGKWVFVAGDTVVRVTPRDQTASERAAERESGNGSWEVQSLTGQEIQIRRVQVRVAVAGKHVSAVLVTKDPDCVGSFGEGVACRRGHLVTPSVVTC
jgi:hypothetical protein